MHERNGAPAPTDMPVGATGNDGAYETMGTPGHDEQVSSPPSPRMPVPVATYVLIVMNVVMYLVTTFFGATSDMLFAEMRLVPSDILDIGHCWSLLTSMFLHAGLAHLVANMYSLFVLGSMCEPIFGRGKYLMTYFIGGVAGGILFSGIHLASGSMVTAVGASGAIFALMGMYGAVLLIARKKAKAAGVDGATIGLDGAWQRYLMLVAINLFVVPMTGNIAWEAHVGGLLAGFCMGMVFLPRTPNGIDADASHGTQPPQSSANPPA